MMLRVHPVEARIFTWDCPAEYGECVSSQDAEIAFAREFPETSWHLKSKGGNFAVLPLVSFVESHQSVSRCLVVVRAAENVETIAKGASKNRKFPDRFWIFSKRWRLLPRQIALYSAAEEFVCRNTTEDDDGHFWCYALVDGVLYSQVFFEGKLAYWSEESGIGREGTSLEAYLCRFRCFLKTDVLFSRVGRFAEIELPPRFERRNFKKSAQSFLWNEVNLQGIRRNFCLEIPWKMLGTVSLLCLALLYEFGVVYSGTDSLSCENCVEAAPVELLSIPEMPKSMEPIEKGSVEKAFGVESTVAGKKCSLPGFRLNGVVGEKLAMFTVATESRVVSLGDSLGDFAVENIGRAGVRLVCGASVVVRGVGDG